MTVKRGALSTGGIAARCALSCVTSLSLGVALAAVPAVAWAQPRPETTKIQKIRIEADGEIDTPRVIDLLGLKKGDNYSETGFEAGLGRLGESGRFKGVEGSYDSAQGLLRVRVSLIETLQGVEIKINPAKGEAVPTYIQADIGDVIGITDGDPVYLDLLQDIRDRVVNRLQERGYLEAKALPVLEQRDNSQNRRLILSVDLGPRSRIKKLRLRGFTARDAEEFVDHLRDQNEIEQFIKNLTLPTKNVFDLSTDIVKKRLQKMHLKGEDTTREVTVNTNLPMDWIALNQSIGRWGQIARERGYYDFQVHMEPEPSGNDDVSVLVTLDRGFRYNVQIHNNTEFWERELRNKILDRTLRLGVPLSVPDAETLIRRQYESRGFSSVVVANRIVDKDNERIINFDITEGPRVYLGDLTLDGIPDTEFAEVNRALRDWRDSLKSPFHPIYYDEKLLKAQLPELLRRIRRRGFLQARILEFRPHARDQSRYVDVELPIQLGTRYTVKSLTITGNIILSERELEKIARLSPGDPVDPDIVAEINQTLLARHRDLGFLNARVEQDEKKIFKTSFDSSEVDVELQIDPGPQVFVGRVIVRGPKKTKEQVVVRELDAVGLKSGAAWSPSKVQAAEQRLLGLGIFGAVKSESVGGRLLDQGRASEQVFERQEKDLKIQASERPAGAIEFGPGFRSDRGLIGFAEFNYRNLGGWNRSVIVRSQISRKLKNYQVLEQKHSITYIEPYLLDLPLKLRLNTSFSREDNTVFKGDVPISGYLSRELSIGAGVETEIARNLRLVQNLYTLSFPYDDQIIGVTDDRQNNRVASIGTQFIFDNRDNIFNPTHGWLISSGIDYASPLIGSDQDSHFAVFRQSVGTYLRITPISVIAVSLSYARLWGLGSTRGIPLTRRLTLGGRTSVRALTEKELQFNDVGLVGQDSFEGKVEYRQPVLLDLGLAFFVDFGTLSALRFVDPSIPAQYKPFVVGPGIGIRYATPVGPVAIDFAFRTNTDTGKTPFRVQISVGNF